jgi:hypothetical protein
MATTPNLQRKLQQTLGAEAAGDLVAWMQSMDGNRNDVSELRREMQVMQVGFARLDGRLEAMQERIEKLLEKGLREQTRFFFLAWSVLLAAIVGLYAR